MAELTYREAVAEAIAQEMRRDENVVFLGEDIGAAGGVFKATVGCSRNSARNACAIRRSRNRPFSGRPWVLP